MKYKKWLLPGAILWILGLAAAIVGLNIHDRTGEWIRVIGEIMFFLGLLIESAVFMLVRRDERVNGSEPGGKNEGDPDNKQIND